VIEETADVHDAILRYAADVDLVVMGIQRGHGVVFGPEVQQVAEASDVPLILIGSRANRRSRG
jgi:nucleotide-binding universal stress UspA family protein